LTLEALESNSALLLVTLGALEALETFEALGALEALVIFVILAVLDAVRGADPFGAARDPLGPPLDDLPGEECFKEEVKVGLSEAMG